MVAKVEKKSPQSSLVHESNIYRRLSNLPCVPRFYYFGEESGYYCLILENVGHDMEDFFRLKKKLVVDIDSGSLAAVVAVEIIGAIEHIHSLGIIHCDIKPANILYGPRLDMGYRFTIVDFGGCWVEGDAQPRVIGNEYFSSPRQLCTSDNYKPSKMDDLVSLGYTVVYLARDCSMSWDSEFLEYSNEKTPEARERWHLVKAKATSDYLCSGLPAAYQTFLHLVLSLAPNHAPDYNNYTKIIGCIFK